MSVFKKKDNPEAGENAERALSPDELDAVSGGVGDDVIIVDVQYSSSAPPEALGPKPLIIPPDAEGSPLKAIKPVEDHKGGIGFKFELVNESEVKIVEYYSS